MPLGLSSAGLGCHRVANLGGAGRAAVARWRRRLGWRGGWKRGRQGRGRCRPCRGRHHQQGFGASLAHATGFAAATTTMPSMAAGPVGGAAPGGAAGAPGTGVYGEVSRGGQGAYAAAGGQWGPTWRWCRWLDGQCWLRGQKVQRQGPAARTTTSPGWAGGWPTRASTRPAAGADAPSRAANTGGVEAGTGGLYGEGSCLG